MGTIAQEPVPETANTVRSFPLFLIRLNTKVPSWFSLASFSPREAASEYDQIPGLGLDSFAQTPPHTSRGVVALPNRGHPDQSGTEWNRGGASRGSAPESGMLPLSLCEPANHTVASWHFSARHTLVPQYPFRCPRGG